jgi:glycosyltransferase involved in cell wall biosynthesis
VSDRRPTVGLIDWCHIIEDFIGNLGVSFDELRTSFRGSWILGYMDALNRAGVRPIWFCVSEQVTAPWRFTHEPTGCLICVLPAPRVYRAIRRRMYNPYAYTVEKAVGPVHPVSRPFYAALKDVAPYLTSPVWHLARELRRERCAALLVQEYENPRFDVCVWLGRLMRMPVFATFQGGQFHYSWTERLFRRLSMRLSAGLIAAPRSESDRLQQQYGVPPSKIARIFNPVDVERWRPMPRAEARAALDIPAGARVVAWHGRVLYTRKGLDILLDAWDRVCADRPGVDLRLLVVGAGNDEAAFRRRIAATEPRGLVWVDRFVSDTTEIARYLSAADLFAFPSRDEGFPLAPVEAMACGLGVLAATAPGVVDIFEDGEASGGVLVPVGDAGAFGAALGRLVDDLDRCRELGRRAQRRAHDGFSPTAIGRRLADLLTT